MIALRTLAIQHFLLLSDQDDDRSAMLMLYRYKLHKRLSNLMNNSSINTTLLFSDNRDNSLESQIYFDDFFLSLLLSEVTTTAFSTQNFRTQGRLSDIQLISSSSFFLFSEPVSLSQSSLSDVADQSLQQPSPSSQLSSSSYFFLGLSFAKLSQESLARRYLSRASSPWDPLAHRLRGHLHVPTVSFSLRLLSQSIEILEKHGDELLQLSGKHFSSASTPSSLDPFSIISAVSSLSFTASSSSSSFCSSFSQISWAFQALPWLYYSGFSFPRQDASWGHAPVSFSRLFSEIYISICPSVIPSEFWELALVSLKSRELLFHSKNANEISRLHHRSRSGPKIRFVTRNFSTLMSCYWRIATKESMLYSGVNSLPFQEMEHTLMNISERVIQECEEGDYHGIPLDQDDTIFRVSMAHERVHSLKIRSSWNPTSAKTSSRIFEEDLFYKKKFHLGIVSGTLDTSTGKLLLGI